MHIVNILLIASVVVLAVGYFWQRSDSFTRQSERWGAIAIAGLVSAAFFGIGSLVLVFGGNACRAKADDLDRDSRYGLAAGCRVETDDGHYVPIDNLRITNEES